MQGQAHVLKALVCTARFKTHPLLCEPHLCPAQAGSCWLLVRWIRLVGDRVHFLVLETPALLLGQQVVLGQLPPAGVSTPSVDSQASR